MRIDTISRRHFFSTNILNIQPSLRNSNYLCPVINCSYKHINYILNFIHFKVKMKALKSFLIAVAGLAFTANAAQAQLIKDTKGWNRIHVAFVTTGYKAENNGTTIKGDDNMVGAAVGFAKGISLSQKLPIFLEPGIDVIWQHQNLEDQEDKYSSFDEKVNQLSFAIPVVAAYKFSFNDWFSIDPFFGVNFKIHAIGVDKETYTVAGKETTVKNKYFKGEVETEYNGNTNTESYGDDDTKAKRFQFGLNLGVGFNISCLYVGYKFQPDLSPLYKYDDYKTKTHSNVITVGLNF